MFYTVAVILLALWLLGFAIIPVAGSLIHLLLLAALITLMVGLIRGRTI
jgi:hypothetical protein